MPELVDETCRNCGEVLFQKKVEDDGTTSMADPGVWPESDGESKYFRCPACGGAECWSGTADHVCFNLACSRNWLSPFAR